MYTNKEGFERREFPNSKEYGPSFYLYDPQTNMQYAGFNFTDTIFYYRADVNVLVDTEIEEIGK